MSLTLHYTMTNLCYLYHSASGGARQGGTLRRAAAVEGRGLGRRGKIGRFLFFGARKRERGRPAQQTIGGHDAEQGKDDPEAGRHVLFLLEHRIKLGEKG